MREKLELWVLREIKMNERKRKRIEDEKQTTINDYYII